MSFSADFRQAVRTLARRPGFTLVAAGTLALGIGATTAIFSVANAVLIRSLPYPAADELVVMWEQDRTDPADDPGGEVSVANFRDVRAEATRFESMAQYARANLTLSGLETSAEVVPGGAVDAALFEVFGAEPILGRTFTAEEQRYGGPDAVVVSESFWRSRLGGDPAVVGSTLTIGGVSHPIVGIAPAGFSFPSEAQLWIPIQNNDEGCGRGCVIFSAVGRLKDDVGVESARSELEAIAGRLEAEYPDSNTGITLAATPLEDLVVGDVRTALWVLLGAVGMVLLIACANVANLILVRGGARRTELAVRSALGAGQPRLLRQLMTENAVLALAGGGAGLLLAWWGTQALVRIAPSELPRLDEVALDPVTLVFGLGVMALTVLVFGLAPALRLSASAPAAALRGSRGALGDRSAHRLRSGVLVAEVALSVMLLLGAGLMVRSLARMQAVELGMTTDDVALFRLSLPSARYPEPGDRVRFVDELEDRLAAVPGVRRAVAVVSAPFGDVSLVGAFTRPDLPEPEPGQGPGAGYRVLGPGALEMLGVELAAGRAFEARDRQGAPPVALINETAARRFWPGEDPVGKTMDLQITVGFPEDEPRTIVGVVRDFREDVTGTIQPEMYVPFAQTGASFPHILLETEGSASAALAAARDVIASLDPQLPMIRPATLDEQVAREMAAPRFYMVLLGLFAVMAMALAAVGIYGVVAYTVVQRTREIGMRMALGARVKEVVRMVVWEGARPALLGLGLGLVGALALARVLAGILFQIAPTDPPTYLAAGLLLGIVVVAATAIPALRAARIAPSEALRVE
jgi:putative ABC transport system permease protein